MTLNKQQSGGQPNSMMQSIHVEKLTMVVMKLKPINKIPIYLSVINFQFYQLVLSRHIREVILRALTTLSKK